MILRGGVWGTSWRAGCAAFVWACGLALGCSSTTNTPASGGSSGMSSASGAGGVSSSGGASAGGASAGAGGLGWRCVAFNDAGPSNVCSCATFQSDGIPIDQCDNASLLAPGSCCQSAINGSCSCTATPCQVTKTGCECGVYVTGTLGACSGAICCGKQGDCKCGDAACEAGWAPVTSCSAADVPCPANYSNVSRCRPPVK